MNKVYQVIEGYYYVGETHERTLGIYSTLERANKRMEQLIKMKEVDGNHLFIKEVMLDVDINCDYSEYCISGW
jgi:hypothetical protein